ncbi:MAG: M15 family metallopeptidase [Clostridia bacterium]|nr:M15 family metallopeptidase [Clostridia bacterium]
MMKKLLIALTIVMAVLTLKSTAYACPSETDLIEETIDGEIIGCTIRTTKETNGSLTNGDKVAIPKDSKCKVVLEENGKFVVSYKGREVLIDTASVLINIAEYLPSIDIQLAMAQEENLFSMADEKIEGLTNRQFYTENGSVEGSEAWLKYEPAKKLLVAQTMFREQGYSIVVYDAYRPYSATKDFQVAYRDFLNGKTKAFKEEWFGSLGESWFLAQKASAHNYGVAMDISLKDLYTGEVVEMPSNMHTLDIRSAYCDWSTISAESTDNAQLLKKVMESAGFSDLKSEWWHFQDNSIKRGKVIDIPN